MPRVCCCVWRLILFFFVLRRSDVVVRFEPVESGAVDTDVVANWRRVVVFLSLVAAFTLDCLASMWSVESQQ